MEKDDKTVLFTCPQCEKAFEYDDIGEFELLPCPVCGTAFITVRRVGKLMLGTLNQTLSVIA